MICDNFPTSKETKKVGYTPRAYVRETWTHDFYVLLKLILNRSYYIFRPWRGENLKDLGKYLPPFKTKTTVEILIK
jgi:hypothetical protein